MARKKHLDAIDNEMNSNVAVVENPNVGEINIAKEVPVETSTAHEFGEEYTMQVIADNEPGADQFRIPNKDPKYAYRFLRDDKINMSVKTSNLLYSKGGWQVCSTEHLMRIGIRKDSLQPDGSYKVGELILAFMPKSLFDKKMKKDKEISQRAMDGVQSLVDGNSRVNVQGVHGISTGSVKKGPLNFGSHNSVEE